MENNDIIINIAPVADILCRRSYVLRCLDHVVAQLETRDEALSVDWGTGELTGCDAAQVAELRSRLADDEDFWRDFLPADARVTPETLAAALPLALTSMFASGATSIHGPLLLPVDRLVLSSDPERQRTLVLRLVNSGRLFAGDLLDNVDLRGSRLPPSCRDAVAAVMAPYAGSYAGLSWPGPCETVKGWLDAWVKSARPSLSALRRIPLDATPLSNRSRNALRGMTRIARDCSDIHDLAALVGTSYAEILSVPGLGLGGLEEICTFLGGVGLELGMEENDFPAEADERQAAAESAAEPTLRDLIASKIITREEAVCTAISRFLSDRGAVTVTYANGDLVQLPIKDVAKAALRDARACAEVLAHPAPLTSDLVRRYLVGTAHSLAAEAGGEGRELPFDPRLLLPIAALGLPGWLETLLRADETIVVGDLANKLRYINLLGRGFRHATGIADHDLCREKLEDLLEANLEELNLDGWPFAYMQKWDLDCENDD